MSLSPTSVKLSWQGADDVDRYVVRFGSDRALKSDATTISATSTTATLEGLDTSGRAPQRFFRVDAYRGKDIASSRTGTVHLLPAAITKLAITHTSSIGLRLAWAPAQNAEQYDVVFAADKAFTTRVQAVRTIGPGREYITDQLTPKQKYFVKIRAINGPALGAFTAPLSFTTKPAATVFAIGSWNVCSEKCNNYATRARIGAAYINDNGIDLFGLQEAGGKRVGRTTNAIWSGGTQGYVRATGGAEAGYIFYRPAMFGQVSGGHFAVGHGRHATWAHLRTKASKRDFFFVNVHLENGHGNDSKRRSEMRTMLGRMARINDTGLPIIYAGDFNSGTHRNSDSPGTMMRAANMVDAVDVTRTEPINAGINTGHTFSRSVLTSGAHVDHLFVSTDFAVLDWTQLARIDDGRYSTPMVSDHNALKSTVSLDAPAAALGRSTLTIAVPSNDLADTLAR